MWKDFEILFVADNLAKFLRGKRFLRGNLICYISETEGCGKLKFDKVSLQICQIFLKIEQKNFRPECPFNMSDLS